MRLKASIIATLVKILILIIIVEVSTVKLNHDILSEDLSQSQPYTYVNSKCNSERLREVIKSANGNDATTLKRNIQSLAETRLQARFNVICAEEDFSYITNTEEYCQETIGPQTCYIFRQFNRATNSLRYRQRLRKLFLHKQ